jgi:hypothetical protein
MTESLDLVTYRVRGGFTTIDRKNDSIIRRHKWRIDKRGSVVADISKPPYRLYLHRVIMHCPKGKEVHHRNGKRRDNYESNMVIVTQEEHLRLHGWKPPVLE